MIEMKVVEKRYPGTGVALYIDSLTINSGEVVGILGGNGSGKTTMLKAIMGIGDIQNGEIRIDSKPVTELYDIMAYITEEGSFLPDLTPEQYADFLSDYYPRFDRDRFKRMVSFYELEPGKKIKAFSKGQKAKLEVCAGLSKGAKYLLMDEPLLSKDMFARRDFLKLLIAGLDGDETLLITTHIMDEIENVIDRALLLHKGRIKADFYMDDMRQEGKSLAAIMSEISGYKEEKYKRVFE